MLPCSSSTWLSLHLKQVRRKIRVLSILKAYEIKFSESSGFDPGLLREAQSHLDQAKRLDPENVLVQAFLEKVRPVPPSLLFHRIDLFDTPDTRTPSSENFQTIPLPHTSDGELRGRRQYRRH